MSLLTSAHTQPQLDFFSLFKLSTVEKKPRKTSTIEKIISTVKKKTTKISIIKKIISIVKKKQKKINH